MVDAFGCLGVGVVGSIDTVVIRASVACVATVSCDDDGCLVLHWTERCVLSDSHAVGTAR